MKRFLGIFLLLCLAIPSNAQAGPPKVPSSESVGIALLEGPVDSDSVGDVIKSIEVYRKNPAINSVVLRINSPGGSVLAGFDLARYLEETGIQVVCVVDGEAASMAFYILQSCDVRLMTSRSMLMAHEPSASGFFGGNPKDWQAMADAMKALTIMNREEIDF